MSFLDHLEELRWHLVRSTLAVVIIACMAFVFRGFIFDTILFGPKNMDFPTYQFFCNIGKFFGIDSEFCGDTIPFTIQSRLMAGQFSAHIWTSIWAGVILGFPYILYELWKFISPGLYENERKHSKGFIITASGLFFLGVLFGYYIVAPLSINFLGSYQVIVIFFLTKVGLVTPEILKKYRKIALVIILILSAIITPPDITSQIIVCIPVLILYQVSIFISRMVVKKEERKEKARNNAK